MKIKKSRYSEQEMNDTLKAFLLMCSEKAYENTKDVTPLEEHLAFQESIKNCNIRFM